MQNDPNTEWVPPPPPEDDSIFSKGTREYYGEEIKKGAIKALVFGLLSWVCCGPIFGYLGYTTAQEVLTNIEVYDVEHGSRGLAIAGKYLSIIGIIFWIVGLVLRIGVNL